jgi:hypothetical protein
MNKKLLSIFGVILFTCFLFAKQVQSPFIAKKKMRGLSKSKLKEENVQELGAVLQALPIAHTQELAMKRLTQYLEGEKSCFWDQASCEQLLECKKYIQAFQQDAERMQVQLQAFIQFLDTMPMPGHTDSANLVGKSSEKSVKKV